MDNAPQPPAPPPDKRTMPLIVIVAIVALGIPFLLAIILTVISVMGGVVAYWLTASSVDEGPSQITVESVIEEYEPPEPAVLSIPEPPEMPEESEPAEAGEDEPTGTLEASVIKEVMKKGASGFKNCYERTLLKDASLAGKVTIKFVIGTNGMVTKAEVASSTLDNAEVEKCVVNRVKKMRFPEPEGGVVSVSYPMVFTAEG